MANIHPSIVWACIGIALIIIEVFTTSFFLLFFGISALLVAALPLLGYHSVAAELGIFGVLGVLGIVIFRNKIKTSFTVRSDLKTDQDKAILLSDDIPAGQTGKIVYRGSPWMAVNNSGLDLKKGNTAFIEKIEGVRLILNQKS